MRRKVRIGGGVKLQLFHKRFYPAGNRRKQASNCQPAKPQVYHRKKGTWDNCHESIMKGGER